MYYITVKKKAKVIDKLKLKTVDFVSVTSKTS